MSGGQAWGWSEIENAVGARRVERRVQRLGLGRPFNQSARPGTLSLFSITSHTLNTTQHNTAYTHSSPHTHTQPHPASHCLRMSAVETPSKAVASSLENIDLSKPTGPKFLDSPSASTNSIKKEHKSAAHVDATTTGPTGRDRFVGNLDITCDADEPLLKETGNRFVLFPIKYHEVSNHTRAVLGGMTRAGACWERFE